MAAAAHHSETNCNAALGDLLRFRLPRWNVTSQATGVLRAAQKEPDVFLEHPSGVPMVIEGKYDLGAANRKQVESDAQLRLGHIAAKTGLEIEQAVAVLYPEHLRTTSEILKDALEGSLLRFAVCSSSKGGTVRFPESGWLEGDVDELANFVELVSVSEQQIADALDLFTQAVTTAVGRLEGVLRDPEKTMSAIGEVLHQEPGEQTTNMAVSIMLNALVFQSAVAENHNNIASPTQLINVASDGKLSQKAVLSTWKDILDIDYWPIFAIAVDVLAAIPSEPAAKAMLNSLSIAAERLTSVSAHTVQDLSGQVFGRLINDRKFLATYYTLPSSATLLAELAVSRLEVDWSDKDAVKELRVADFACGTGALLSAVYRQVASRVRRKGIDDATIHRDMLENVLIGADIMPAAVHITASMLSSVHPTKEYTNTCTHVMPYGEQTNMNIAIGSLNLIQQNSVRTLWGDGTLALTSFGENPETELNSPHQSCDLVIMNPPYTNPTNHKTAKAAGVPVPSFAGFGTEEEEQKKMSSELKKINAKLPFRAGDGNAGLATSFIDLANAKVKPNGVVAFVLPATFVSGAAWGKARSLLSNNYKDICVISITAEGSKKNSFSADTSIAEVLVIATRLDANSYDLSQKTNECYWTNIESRPKFPVEASAVASSINLVIGQGREDADAVDIRLGDDLVGRIVVAPFKKPLSLVDSEFVAEAASNLAGEISQIYLPRDNSSVVLPLTQLKYIGERGKVHRDIVSPNDPGRGPFTRHQHPNGDVIFPAIWSHRETDDTRLVVVPDSELKVIDNGNEKAKKIWSTATRLHFTLEFGFGSQHLVACLTPKRCIGGRSWPSFSLHPPKETDERLDWVYPVLLWANSTLGMILFWFIGSRQQTGRSNLTITRLPDLPVLDPRELSEKQIQEAKKIFDEFKDREFLPANEAYRDKTRKELDKAVLVRLLGLDTAVLEWLDVLRDQWCREPTVHGGKSTRPS